MTAAAPAAGTVDQDEPSTVPGYCSDHPNQVLVTHRRARVRWPYLEDPAVVCPADGHSIVDCERCRWCGGRLADELGRMPSPRTAYCGSLHRLHAFRVRARGGNP